MLVLKRIFLPNINFQNEQQIKRLLYAFDDSRSISCTWPCSYITDLTNTAQMLQVCNITTLSCRLSDTILKPKSCNYNTLLFRIRNYIHYGILNWPRVPWISITLVHRRDSDLNSLANGLVLFRLYGLSNWPLRELVQWDMVQGQQLVPDLNPVVTNR